MDEIFYSLMVLREEKIRELQIIDKVSLPQLSDVDRWIVFPFNQISVGGKHSSKRDEILKKINKIMHAR